MKSKLKKSEIKGLRSAFIADLAQRLENRGEVWSGKAALCQCAPENRLIFLDPNSQLFDLTTENYHNGASDSLVRVRVNESWILPKKIDRLKWERGCQRLEITLRDIDLPDLVPYLVALMIGQVAETREYVWDPRAIRTLPQEAQDRLADCALDLALEQKGGR